MLPFSVSPQKLHCSTNNICFWSVRETSYASMRYHAARERWCSLHGFVVQRRRWRAIVQVRKVFITIVVLISFPVSVVSVVSSWFFWVKMENKIIEHSLNIYLKQIKPSRLYYITLCLWCVEKTGQFKDENYYYLSFAKLRCTWSSVYSS